MILALKFFYTSNYSLVEPVTQIKYVANMNKRENGWSNFSASFRVVALKLAELIRFALQINNFI